eukprot:COSAG05_NODE_1047_length_6041_cov_141.646247_2_plen_55_part_00
MGGVDRFVTLAGLVSQSEGGFRPCMHAISHICRRVRDRDIRVHACANQTGLGVF